MAKVALIVFFPFALVLSIQSVVGLDEQIKDFIKTESGDAPEEATSSLGDEELSPDQIMNIGSEVKKAFQDIESSPGPDDEGSPTTDVALTPEQENEFYLGIGMAIKAYLVHQAEAKKTGEALSPGQEREFMENFLKGFIQYLEKEAEESKEDNADTVKEDELSPDQVKNIGLEIEKAFQNTKTVASPNEKASPVIDVALSPKQESLSAGQEKELEKNFLKGFT